MKSEMPLFRYTCPKCGGRNYRLSEIRVTYSPFSRMFDFKGSLYSVIVCEKCRYTEFYNIPKKEISRTLDLVSGR